MEVTVSYKLNCTECQSNSELFHDGNLAINKMKDKDKNFVFRSMDSLVVALVLLFFNMSFLFVLHL